MRFKRWLSRCLFTPFLILPVSLSVADGSTLKYLAYFDGKGVPYEVTTLQEQSQADTSENKVIEAGDQPHTLTNNEDGIPTLRNDMAGDTESETKVNQTSAPGFSDLQLYTQHHGLTISAWAHDFREAIQGVTIEYVIEVLGEARSRGAFSISSSMHV
ncbi:hypothetical protein GZ77_08650 [Endozoicomonas montiporae]|uniref:Uncharacterized protein n=2 Tax=Endozoicomonas montiporae TaxID=1027273 RepID=A0A081N7K7_9GAMM|nr:hypothetical protein [Endozoicomonas montiporae]AMO55731.1 hypothetical protein EZMO1_1568 [Endozoicomonas montiporae CL-33]KEQ14430.1 hypothetical protein GZ77_08650 [Endozoicomonas montiporae]